MESQVIRAHRSNYPDPVKFSKNETIEIGVEDREYPGWIWVKTKDGNEGWAPVSYVKILDHNNTGTTISSYCTHELNVEIGDKLQITSTLNGWHYATKPNGDRGWVPADCVHCR